MLDNMPTVPSEIKYENVSFPNRSPILKGDYIERMVRKAMELAGMSDIVNESTLRLVRKPYEIPTGAHMYLDGALFVPLTPKGSSAPFEVTYDIIPPGVSGPLHYHMHYCAANGMEVKIGWLGAPVFMVSENKFADSISTAGSLYAVGGMYDAATVVGIPAGYAHAIANLTDGPVGVLSIKMPSYSYILKEMQKQGANIGSIDKYILEKGNDFHLVAEKAPWDSAISASKHYIDGEL